MNKRGKWIAIDGCEGAGKTTLVEALKKRFPSVVYVPEFSDTQTGRFLANGVKDKPYEVLTSPLGSALLFVSDYFYLVDTVITPALKNGKTVVSDRGFLSKIAVQSVVLGKSLSSRAVEELLASLFAFSVKPDFSIVLDTPVAEVEKRIVCRCGSCGEERLKMIEDTMKEIRKHAQQWGLPCGFYTGSDAERVATEQLSRR